jgi:alginate O-acetyltransferase complex protein AlgI
VNGSFVYYLTSYLPILCAAAVASTPVGVKVFHRLPGKTKEIVGVLLVLAGLVVCTAYLVDGTYNPFLYFRF